MNNRNVLLTGLSTLTVLVSGLNAAQATEIIIEKINIEGNARMSDIAIKSIISYREGDSITKADEKSMVEELFFSGRFSNVSVKIMGNTLNIVVNENAMYNDFIFKGNKIIKEVDLKNSIGIKVRSIYTKRTLAEAISNIKAFYKSRGYYSAKISVRTIKKTDNRVDLEFDIDEGDIVTIKKINFIGNSYFDDGNLRHVILSKENVWYKFLADDDIYSRGRIEVDKQSIRNYYRNRGFADIKVIDVKAKLSKNKQDFFITYKLKEGKRYKLGKVKIIGFIPEINKAKLNEKLDGGDRRGFFYAKGLNDITFNLKTELTRQGINFIEVSPKMKRRVNSAGESIMDIDFKLQKSARVFIERIVIRGNTRTLDRVIRKELEIVEGDPFNALLMRISETNIRKLGFFSDIKVSFIEGTSKNKAIVYIDVKEKTTGTAGFGFGFSNTKGVVFQISTKENNFLGRGQKTNISIKKSGKDVGLSFGFTEPYFMGRDLLASVNVSRENIDRMLTNSYKAKEIKLGLAFQYNLNRKWTQSVSVGYQYYDLYEVATNASLSVKDEIGRSKSFTFSHKLEYTDVDDYYNPTSGVKASVTTSSRSVSSKYKNYFLDLRGTYYYPVNEKMRLSIGGTASKIVGYTNVRFVDRLYLNSDYIRGFSKIGSRDTTSGDLLGGTTRATLNIELDFPVGLPESMGVKGSTFINAAYLGGTPKLLGITISGGDEFRTSAGAGVKWSSPIGVMRLDYTRVIKKSIMDIEQVIQFTLDFGLN